MISDILQRGWFLLAKYTGVLNRVAYQRRHWRRQLKIEEAAHVERIGFDWGDPESSNDRLGNYRRVLELLTSLISPDTAVVEIGSYGGKWTRYLLPARRVVCVDLFPESFDCIRRRFQNPANVEFYRTSGNELAGIASNQFDLVFSIDSLPRVPPTAIRRYIEESMRVLKGGGRIFLHLPCSDIEFCRRRRFTAISREWISDTVRAAGFIDADLDLETLRHGALVRATKPIESNGRPLMHKTSMFKIRMDFAQMTVAEVTRS